MHANVALDISTMACTGQGRELRKWVFEYGKGWDESGDFGRDKMKMEREKSEQER